MIDTRNSDVDNCGISGAYSMQTSVINIGGCNIDHDGVGGDATYGARANVNSFISAYNATIDTSGHITTDTSPTKSTANDPVFGNLGSWIYGN